MIETRQALQAAFSADDMSAPIIAGSTTTTIQLAAGQVAADGWRQGDVLHLTGSGVTADNHRVVRTALAVSSGADTLTVAALPVEPSADDQVRCGLAHWIRAIEEDGDDAVLAWSPRQGKLAAAYLEEAPADPRAVATCGFAEGQHGLMARFEEEGRLRLHGWDRDWLDGVDARFRRLFHSTPGALVVAGRDAWTITVRSSLPQVRDEPGGILEILIPFSLATAPAYA